MNEIPQTTVMQPTPVMLPPAPPMSLAEKDTEVNREVKRMRQHSPSRVMSPASYLRREGVRKKNHKMEIPRGRSLDNIDMLIQKSTDDDEIKELKQQKRLLRNRQAA